MIHVSVTHVSWALIECLLERTQLIIICETVIKRTEHVDGNMLAIH